MEKRGLSSIVVAVLIILFVLVSIFLVWWPVRDSLSNLDSVNTDKFSTSLEIFEGSVIVDENNSLLYVTVYRPSGTGNITGVIVKVDYDSGESETTRVPLVILELETRVVNVSYTPSKGNLTKISLAPIFDNNGVEDIGFVTDEYDFGGGNKGGGGDGGSGDDGNDGGGDNKPACDDGVDNDGDGWIDLGDVGCDNSGDDDESSSWVNNYYFVSTSGSDSSSGTVESPWKTLQKAADVVQAGDVVYVREGNYRDLGLDDPNRGKMSLKIKSSGNSGEPVVFKAYPGEIPVIDGFDVISSFNGCTSEEECKNISSWQNVVSFDVDSEASVLNSYLMESSNLGFISMDPEPADKVNFKDPSGWYSVPSEGYSGTSIKDQSYFNQPDSNYWNDSYVAIYVGIKNEVYMRKILSYDNSTGTITFDFTHSSFDATKDSYAVLNHPSFVDKSGEYFIDELNDKVYLDIPGGPNKIEFSGRNKGLNINEQSNLIFDGLTFRGFSGDWISDAAINTFDTGSGLRSSNVVLKNLVIKEIRANGLKMNKVDDLLIENVTIARTSDGRGIEILNGNSVTVQNSELERVGRTGVYFGIVSAGYILNNTNKDSTGVHGNGISVYQGSQNVLIEENYVLNSGIALTIQASDDITIRKNIFDRGSTENIILAGWSFSGTNPNNIVIEQNTFVSESDSSSFFIHDSYQNVIVKDNILPGGNFYTFTHSNNLFTNLDASQNYNLGDFSESLASKSSFMSGYLSKDYTPDNGVVGSPPVNPCTMSSIGSYVGAVSC